jgi:parvulin-like peptidyl-prolyl isomerase
MANRKTPKVISKKHLARLERERRQARIINISAIVILAGLFLAIIYGILNETVLLNYRPVTKVNGEAVSVREFQVRVKVARQQLIDQFMQYYQLVQMFGGDPTQDASLMSINDQLNDPVGLAQQVLQQIEADLLIRQYAQANNITVTPEEVEQSIQSVFRFYPNGTPTPTASSTPVVFSTLSAAQLDLVTATPTFVPTFTPTRSPAVASTPTTSPLPTSTPFTQEGFDKLYQDGLDYYAKLGVDEEMFRRIFFEQGLYNERVKAAVTADVPRQAEKVWARHILVSEEATANTVRTLLLAGGDFATLAGTYSIDPNLGTTGGDIGWFAMGETTWGAEFETAAFALEVGEISEPVAGMYGYHIIQVIGHETRPLTADEYQAAVDAAFDAWLEEQRAAAVIEESSNWIQYVPEEPTLQQAFMDTFATQTAMAPTYEAEQKTIDAQFALTPSATPPTPTSTP